MQKIEPCLWFNTQAEEAAKLYTSLFKNSKIGKTARYSEAAEEVSGKKAGSVMTVEFEIEGLKVLGLNGGPLFKFTPAHSFFVWCKTESEVTKLWQTLSKDGTVRMGLDKYPWAEKYGWTADKYGVEWQIMISTENNPSIAPAFLFVDKLFGKGEEAIKFYTSVFPNSKIELMNKDEKTQMINHCIFTLEDQKFVLMEGQGEHKYTFSEAFSLIVNCNTQEEIDQYWTKLSADKTAEQCGWLKDKYGVSWQITPKVLGEMLSDKNPRKAENVMEAMLQMKKIDIKKLEEAYRRE